MEEHRDFTIELPNLIAILGCALYSSWQVAIRELVQNAHDAIQRLAVRSGEDGRDAGWIRIECDSAGNMITIEDSGEGMTLEQVRDDLSCIGAGGSSRLRSDLIQKGRRAEANRIIGQFGVGLLASFLLAEWVEIETRAHGAGPDDGLLWVSRGGAGYTIRSIRRERPGTKVTLHLGLLGTTSAIPSFHIQHRRALALAEVLRPGALDETVAYYCELLPVQICCNGRSISSPDLPWEAPSPAETSRQYLCRRFNERIQDVIVLSESWCDGLAGGALFVSSLPPSPQGTRIDLFLQRMYLCRDNGSILPPWAGFLAGTINAWELTPDLDRENVKHDHLFVHVRNLLAVAIVRAFREMEKAEPERLQQWVARHSALFRSHIPVMPSELVRVLAPALLFNTVDGPKPLQEIILGQRPQDGRTLLFSDRTEELRRDLLKSLANVSFLMLPSDEDEQRALQSCIDAIGTYRLHKYFLQPDQLLPAARHPRWKSLKELCQAIPLNVEVQVCEFPTTEIPALVLRRDLMSGRRELIGDLLGQKVGAGALDARLAGSREGAVTEECLFLNANCDLFLRMVEKLERGRPPVTVEDAMRLAVRAVWHVARAISDEKVTPERALRLLSGQRELANRLLTLAESGDQVEPGEADEEESSRICFLACPFDEHADGLEAIVESELRKLDSRWRVRRADREADHPELFHNIRLLIRSANLCVADLTGWNANVLLEVGIALAMGRRVVPLVSREEMANIPADLKHLTIEPYERAHRSLGIRTALVKVVGR